MSSAPIDSPAPKGGSYPCTVDGLAEYLRLDGSSLREHGWADTVENGRKILTVTNRDESGAVLCVKIRHWITGGIGAKYTALFPGQGAHVYGGHCLTWIRPLGRLVFVEGETDCLPLWNAGFPALGVPGASCAAKIGAEHLEGIREVFVVEESDQAGKRFVADVAARVRSLGINGEVRSLRMPGGVKDPADLFREDPERFRDRFAAALDVAGTCGESQTAAKREARIAPQSGLPTIVVNNRHLRDVSAETRQALQDANEPPVLFERDGSLVRTRTDEKGRPTIQLVNEAMLRNQCTAAADFVRRGDHGDVKVSPPLEVVRDVSAHPELPFPPLEGITETPILQPPDGIIVDHPGYDRSSRMIYAPAFGLELPEIPAMPTERDRAEALESINDLLGEFPYADEASSAAALATLVTAVCRTAIVGPCPLCLIDAPQAGTGKSLLGGGIAVVATGREAAVLSPPASDEELRKLITSQLIAGGRFLCFDNLDRPLAYPSLSRAVTASFWEDRPLGRSELVTLAVQVTWLVTANNIRLKGDLARRSYWCRLDAKTSRPWERTGFRHPDLIAWAKSNRGRLVVAVLTLARAWYVAGQPAANSPTIGGFEEWSRIVGGILHHAGIRGFLSNLRELYDEADEEASQWEAFLSTLDRTYPDGRFTVADIAGEICDRSALRDALPDDLAELATEPGKAGSLRRRLGKALSKRSGRRFGADGLRIEKVGERHQAAVWSIRSDDTTGELTSLGSFHNPNVRETSEDSHANAHVYRVNGTPTTPILPLACSTCGAFDCDKHSQGLAF